MQRALCFQPDPTLGRTLVRALRALDFEVLATDDLAEARGWLLAADEARLIVVSDLGPVATELLGEARRRCPTAWRVHLGATDAPAGAAADPLAESLSLSQLRQALERAAAPLLDLNREQMLDCSQGDGEALESMYELFLSGARLQLDRLEAALAAGDEATGRQALHRLQGAAATAGAERLASLCHHGPDTRLSPALAARLRDALGAFEQAYRDWPRPAS